MSCRSMCQVWPSGVKIFPCCSIIFSRALRDEPGQFQTLKDAKQAFERDYLISVLRITEGHVANAARIAGRNRTEFYKLLNQHNIDPTGFRKNTRAADSED